ncbi:MAG: hypothetical protein KGH61_03325 [Candidatus Micrarchaeota archaeon]|nr:hypothetical protein [Candidatus Micrarchaeota archaeon]MDE1847953.1 hypothetical protein [Candidatus Micrarchaeota archaeon]MDE1864329.1 hypothetical protein [Candidatus Micrarchaeota archaeon]
MESLEVISSIQSIYDNFSTLPNLRLHMLRVAAVGEQICDSWKGKGINKGDVVATLLLHDLGNIVVVDFDSSLGKKMLGGDRKRIKQWKQVKKSAVSRYGTDDHRATILMAGELGVSRRLMRILGEMSDLEFDVLASGDVELKICFYSDLRVWPMGVTGLGHRLDDLKERHRISDKDYAKMKGDAFKIEEWIFGNASIRPGQINNKSVKGYIDRYGVLSV